MKRRIISSILASALIVGSVLSGCGSAEIYCELKGLTVSAEEGTSEEAEGEVKLEEVELPMYFRSCDDERTIKLYFADKDHEIPYIDTATVKELLEDIYHDVDFDKKFSLTVEKDGHKALFTRENSYTMEIDCDADTINFLDYDAFFKPSYSPTVIDALEHYGTIPCLEVVEGSSYSRYGSEVSFDLKHYGIDLIEEDGECYIPLQTFGDLVTSLSSYINFLYSGNGVYVSEYSLSDSSDLLEKYYEDNDKDPKRSKTLAEFTYQELCMVMDYCYGLKEQHNIESFDKYFDETGLKRKMLSEDAIESSEGLHDLMGLYLGDIHSAYVGNSWRVGKDTDIKGSYGNAMSDFVMFDKEFGEARDKAYPDGVPGYEEIGNTAYITFEMFDTMPADTDYYKNPPTADTEDTVGVCLYAFSRITRKNSPIENVVLDMSYNFGGDQTTSSFVLSMFLGEASLCVENTLTGAYMSERFHADANLDGKFDEKDSLKDYRLFCLTSPVSFSCGNLVPSVLRNSNRVKTVGMPSAGGTCMVMPISAADGTLLQISGYRRFSYMKNGSVYDIDQGVETDYPITTIDRFYDRKKLTKYLNGLY